MAIRRYPLIMVDINNRSIEQVILHEGESEGTVLPFKILDNGVPLDLTGYTVNFYLIKPDGKRVLNSCVIADAKAGLVEYTVTSQTVAKSGRGLLNIQILDNGNIAYSGGIRTQVEYTGMGGGSTGESNIFTEIVEKAEKSAEDAKGYALSALEAYTKSEQVLRAAEQANSQAQQHEQQARACQEKSCACATESQKSATAAGQSAAGAKGDKDAAAKSATDAAASAAAAKTSEANAKSSETAAANSAAEASQSKVAAKASADSAKTEAGKAAASAATAETQATTATNKAAEAAASATAAKGSQDAAALSAQAADAKATAAIGSANTAERASNSAGVAATAAFNNANEAKTSADKAKASETNAAGSASTAQTIADNLQGTVDAANQATTRANTAAERAEQAAQTVQPDATKTRKGIVQIGEGINIDSGVISVPAPDLSSKADKVHKHSTSDITGLDAALNEAGKVKSVNGQTGDVTILAVPTGGTVGQVLKKKSKGFGWGDDDDTQPDLTPYAKTADLDKKVDKVSGKGLSANDYTTAEKTKLAGIAKGANKFDLKPASAQMLGGIKVGTNLSIAADGTLSAKDTTYNPATTTKAGLMSAADKLAVNGIGNASEAPSVTDKSSVWAAINEAASKGGDSALMNLLKTDLERLRNDLEGVYGAAGSWALSPDAETRDAIISEYLARLTVLTNGTAQAMQAIKGALLKRGINPGNYKIEEYANLINAALFLDLASLGRVSPGPKELKTGDLSCGYFGKVESSEFGAISGTNTAADGKILSASNLATAVGVTEGTVINETVPWHKFIFKGEIIYIAEKGIREKISFEAIASMGCVYGSKIITMNDKKFRVTLLKGIDADIYNSKKGAPTRNTASEWDILLRGLSQNPETINWGTNLTDKDLGIIDSDNKDCCAYVKEPTTDYVYELGSYSGSYDYYGAITIKSSVPSYSNNNTGYTKSIKAVSSAYCWRPALRFTL